MKSSRLVKCTFFVKFSMKIYFPVSVNMFSIKNFTYKVHLTSLELFIRSNQKLLNRIKFWWFDSETRNHAWKKLSNIRKTKNFYDPSGFPDPLEGTPPWWPTFAWWRWWTKHLFASLSWFSSFSFEKALQNLTSQCPAAVLWNSCSL